MHTTSGDTDLWKKTWSRKSRVRLPLRSSHPLPAPKIVMFKVCSGGTQPVTSLIVKRSHRYIEDFSRDLPAVWRPREGFFIISIFKQSFRYWKRQRIGTSRYRYDLYWVPPAIVFFAVEVPWFNLEAFWVVKPLKCVFYCLNGWGPSKKRKKFAEM